MVMMASKQVQRNESYARRMGLNRGSHGGSKKGRTFKNRDPNEADERLEKLYFAKDSIYNEVEFKRRFRMSKHLFLHILASLETHDSYFTQRMDAAHRLGITPKVKLTTALRLLAYRMTGDILEDKLGMAEETANQCMKRFCKDLIEIFGEEYLRSPTPIDQEYLLAENTERGFPGCLGSIDCMHWEWKNCPTEQHGTHVGHIKAPTLVLEAVASKDLWIWHSFFGLPGSHNDINILEFSPVFNNYLNGVAPPCHYTIGTCEEVFTIPYYLCDGIYPNYAALIPSIHAPHGRAQRLFVTKQEAMRKDIERAFARLQSKWAIISHPARGWKLTELMRTMKACTILHNMTIHDERGDQIRDYVPDYNYNIIPVVPTEQYDQQGWSIRNAAIHSHRTHVAVKTALIEHIW